MATYKVIKWHRDDRCDAPGEEMDGVFQEERSAAIYASALNRFYAFGGTYYAVYEVESA